METRSRLSEGLGTSKSSFLENRVHEWCSTIDIPETVGTGWRDIEDCTSLDEEVQHKRTPFGDMHPLRGTGGSSAQDLECVAITYSQPQYFG